MYQKYIEYMDEFDNKDTHQMIDSSCTTTEGIVTKKLFDQFEDKNNLDDNIIPEYISDGSVDVIGTSTVIGPSVVSDDAVSDDTVSSDSSSEDNDSDKDEHDESVEDKRKKIEVLGMSGLRNLGNTCFMNSIIQCISASGLLLTYITEKRFLPHLIAKIKEQHPELEGEDLEKQCKQTMTYQLYRLLRGMWSGNFAISPTSFKKMVDKRVSFFGGTSQHDSQEFLALLLDTIHEELATKKRIDYSKIDPGVNALLSKRKATSNAIEATDDDEVKKQIKNEYREYIKMYEKEFVLTKSYITWQSYTKKSHSIITELFTGLYYSKVICSECDYRSDTFEPFTLISLPIPESDEKVSLNDCLSTFTKCETLKGDEKWKCKHCDKKVEATKTISLWTLPPILVIHFKRTVKKGYRKEKISTEIDFPISGLQLDDQFSELHRPNVSPKYDLYAISNHTGMPDGGHYFSYCQNMINKKWFEFNDRHVLHISDENSIVSDKAYVLFYKRRV